jgi:magnesium-transporting ATPase (P-type)
LWNSSARIEVNDGKDANIKDEFVTKGNVTEQGLIKFFMGTMGGKGCLDVRNKLKEENILTVISFTSSRKRASIVVRNPEQEGTSQEVRVYCKGAPDMLFDFTSEVITENGSIENLNSTTTIPNDLLNEGEAEGDTDTHRGLFERTVKKFAHRAYRTLLITYKDMSMDEFQELKARHNNFEKEKDREVLEKDLVAVGIFGL